uniref:IPT/TIG domain-containing protein n=1 Tax=viral metagenome TaxID=1070528 RepID=A0A6C0J9C4_9ZZZZ
MTFLYKLLIVIIVVSLLVLGISYDIHKSRVPIESFQDFQTTTITNFTPKEGDGSTIVTIEGRGLEYIEEVLFKGSECVILDNATSSKIQIIPPALTELGFTIEQIRKKIDETGSGIPVDVKLQKKNGGKTPLTSVLLPNIVFTYIDKGANWKDNCPKVEEEIEPEIPKAPAEEPDIDVSEGEAKFKEGTDLYFLHVTLPDMEKKLETLINQMTDKLEEQKKNNPELENADKLKLIQSMDSLLKYKQDMNILRYNIHKNLSDDYGYDI